MQKNISNKTCYIYTSLAQEDYTKIEKQYIQSTCRSLSEFTRNIFLHTPITLLYRNQSLDDLIEEIVVLNKEMNSLKEDLPSMVEKLLVHPQNTAFTPNLQGVELELNKVYKSIEDLKNQIEKITDKWLLS